MMCAHAGCASTTSRTKPALRRAGRSALFDRVIERYDRGAATGCWTASALTLLVAVGTLVLTVLLYIVIPKGLFPIQDTGLLQGDHRGAADRSRTRAMAELPAGSWPTAILQRSRRREPVARSSASTAPTPTLNTGRHADQPEAARRPQRDRQRDHPPPAARDARDVAGITLYLQPVQDLTIDADGQPHPVPVRRWRAPTRRRSTPGCRKLVDALAQMPQLAQRRHRRCRTRACRRYVDIDRDTAARLGITAATVDDALYDAFGQRIVSTIFTAVQPVPRDPRGASPSCATAPTSLDNLYLPARRRRADAAVGDRHASSEQPAPLQINHVGQFPADHDLASTRAGRRRSATRSTRSARPQKDIGMPASDHDHLPGRGGRLPGVARPTSCG